MSTRLYALSRSMVDFTFYLALRMFDCAVAVYTAHEKQSPSYESSSDSNDDDDDDDDGDVNAIMAMSSPMSRAEQLFDAAQVPRRHSADDRPITPMRNQMLYHMMLESQDFDDGALR